MQSLRISLILVLEGVVFHYVWLKCLFETVTIYRHENCFGQKTLKIFLKNRKQCEIRVNELKLVWKLKKMLKLEQQKHWNQLTTVQKALKSAEKLNIFMHVYILTCGKKWQKTCFLWLSQKLEFWSKFDITNVFLVKFPFWKCILLCTFMNLLRSNATKQKCPNMVCDSSPPLNSPLSVDWDNLFLNNIW